MIEWMAYVNFTRTWNEGGIYKKQYVFSNGEHTKEKENQGNKNCFLYNCRVYTWYIGKHEEKFGGLICCSLRKRKKKKENCQLEMFARWIARFDLISNSQSSYQSINQSIISAFRWSSLVVSKLCFSIKNGKFGRSHHHHLIQTVRKTLSKLRESVVKIVRQ